MDNEEIQGVKFSEFPSATPDSADEVVGLHAGDNARFSVANFILAIRQGLANLFVPLTRTINNKALSSNITLNASDIGAQDTITASGILKGDGAGGVTAATAGTDYQAPLTTDATPTANSTNPVQSGGVYTDVRTRVPVYGMGENLLDNWYFMQSQVRGGQLPINRRGLTTLSTNTAYFIDRWATFDGAGTVSIGSSGLSLTGTTNFLRFGQQIPMWKIVGKQITLSVLVESVSSGATLNLLLGDSSGGLINNYGVDGIGQITVTAAGLYQVTGVPTQRTSQGANANDLANILFRISAGASAVVKAVKLEYGSEQTLAHLENDVWVLNEIPDYDEEIIKCETNKGTIDTFANKSLATEQQLAYVETSSTASRAYAVGEYFCWGGLLYRVTSAISSGGTFTVGTNCELRTNGGFNDMAFSGTVTTGSLHDITKSGIYYLGGAVADKPSQNGGMYVVAAYNALIAGLFVDVVNGSTYSINYINGTWNSHQI